MKDDDNIEKLKKRLAEKDALIGMLRQENDHLKEHGATISPIEDYAEPINQPRGIRIGFNPDLGGARVTTFFFLSLIGLFIWVGIYDYFGSSALSDVEPILFFLVKWIYCPFCIVYSLIGYLTPE